MFRACLMIKFINDTFGQPCIQAEIFPIIIRILMKTKY